MGDTAVRVLGLAKRYGTTVALDGVDIEVARGSLVAVLGPNGAGKTTTIEICEGFRTPDTGTVEVLGRDPRRDHAALTPLVGVMPQGGTAAIGAYVTARTGEVLRHAAALYARPHDPAALLERVGLSDAARTPYRRLSGGQQQRLSLALALVGKPELVFLDEPTAGLDVSGRHLVWELLADLRAAGVTVVLTTHALDEAEHLADRVVILAAGRVVAEGTPTELTRNGAVGELRFSARSRLPLGELLAALPSGTSAREVSTGSYLVSGDMTPQLLASVTAWCASHGVFADALRVEQRSLEDVFLEVTRS